MKTELECKITDVYCINGEIYIRLKCGGHYKTINFNQASNTSDKSSLISRLTEVSKKK